MEQIVETARIYVNNTATSLEVSKEKKVTVIVPHCEEIPEKLLVHPHNSGVCHR